MSQTEQQSKLWYLVPIFLGIIPGSIIAYFALRNSSPEMAKNCWIIGIISVVIFVIGGIIFGYVAGEEIIMGSVEVIGTPDSP